MITVGDSIDGAGNELCVADGGDTKYRYIIDNQCVPPLTGKYVHVKLNTGQILTLCEVEIYGEGTLLMNNQRNSDTC